jgi:hypothetical protein
MRVLGRGRSSTERQYEKNSYYSHYLSPFLIPFTSVCRPIRNQAVSSGLSPSCMNTIIVQVILSISMSDHSRFRPDAKIVAFAEHLPQKNRACRGNPVIYSFIV